jgi:hypothetical protein
MSKNRNRAKLNKAHNGREYGNILTSILYPAYSEYDHTWHHGDLSNHKWRSYKTWKHNRLKRWKNNGS